MLRHLLLEVCRYLHNPYVFLQPLKTSRLNLCGVSSPVLSDELGWEQAGNVTAYHSGFLRRSVFKTCLRRLFFLNDIQTVSKKLQSSGCPEQQLVLTLDIINRTNNRLMEPGSFS